MEKKMKGKIPYPESGAAQTVLWTDIPLHAKEVQSVEPAVKEARNKRETFITHAEVHSQRDSRVKKTEKSGHREKRAKSRTREQMTIPDQRTIPDQSSHRGSRQKSKTRNSETQDSDQSQFLKYRDNNTTRTKYRDDRDPNFRLRKRNSPKPREQPYSQDSYFTSRDIFETGGEEHINFGHCSESRTYSRSDVKHSEDRRQEHRVANRNLTDTPDRLFSPKHSGNTGAISKNTKGHKLEYNRQNQHLKQDDEIFENWREPLPRTDNRHFGEKSLSEDMSLNPNAHRQDSHHPENKKLTNTKGDRLELKENRKFASTRTLNMDDQSDMPTFHQQEGQTSEVREGEMETSFSEARFPGPCSDIAPIITETEATVVTAQFGLFSLRWWRDAKERVDECWRNSLCERNLKKYSFFYVAATIVGFICILVSSKVSVDLIDIPLSISMVCFVCSAATFVCERGCLLTYFEYQRFLDEAVPQNDHGFNCVCSDCCPRQISPVRRRGRRHRSEANTAFEHEVADVSQISALECPQIRVVLNEDIDCSESPSPNDLSQSSKTVAAVVHSPKTRDESNDNICEHHGQNNCGCAPERTSAIADKSCDDNFNVENHQDDRCKAEDASSPDHLMNEFKIDEHTKEMYKGARPKVTSSYARKEYNSISEHGKKDECADAFESQEDKSDETDASLDNDYSSSDDFSSFVYDNDDLPVGDEVSSTYENSQAAEVEQAHLLEKEKQKPQSYFSPSGGVRSGASSSFAQSRAPTYHIKVCEYCGKQEMGPMFFVNGKARMGEIHHECEYISKRTNLPASQPRKEKSDGKDNSQRHSSDDDDVYVCEHYGQAVACGCAEILLKKKSNTKK